MDVEIVGMNAGVVWGFLNDQEGKVTLHTIKKKAGLRADEAMAALGWLAREGKVEFEQGPRSILVGLCLETTPA